MASVEIYFLIRNTYREKLYKEFVFDLLHINLSDYCIYIYYRLTLNNNFRFPERKHRSLPEVSLQLRPHGPDSCPPLAPGEHRLLWWRSWKRDFDGSRDWSSLCSLLDDQQRRSRG